MSTDQHARSTRGPRWPSRERRPEQEPAIDTEARHALSSSIADPAEWGMTPEDARDLVGRQMCPVCGEGPWKSPLNHVARKHGIGAFEMRDACLLSTSDKVTDEVVRARWAEHGRESVAALTERDDARWGGAGGRHSRTTRAGRKRLEDQARKMQAEHPTTGEQLRKRMADPQVQEKWRRANAESIRKRVRTDEQISDFAARMASPEIQAKRAARREESRIDQCSVEGCAGAHVAKGYCAKHWRKAKAYGDPTGQGRIGHPPALSPEQMDQARVLCASGVSQHRVAEMMGVSQSAISRVMRR